MTVNELINLLMEHSRGDEDIYFSAKNKIYLFSAITIDEDGFCINLVNNE